MAEAPKKDFVTVPWYILAVVLFGAGVYLAAQGKSGGPVTATYGAAVAVLIYARLHLFRRIKFFDIEAELRDTVKEAHATIQHLRSIALVLGETALWQASKTGRFWNPDTDEKVLEIQEKVFDVFDQLGLSDEEKEHAARDVRRITRIDFAIALAGGSTIKYTPIDMKHERSQLLEGDPNPDSLRAFLEKAGQLGPDADPELESILADFKHYCETGEHRRWDVFLDRKNWPEKYLREMS